VAVPSTIDGLRRAIGEAHCRYTREINQREGWRGHLWQGRFLSFVMDERYTLAAARYIERNPVRAGLVVRAEDYPWSSARAHVAGKDDGLVTVAPMLEMVREWRAFLAAPDEPPILCDLRKHATTGRPLGDERFVGHLEKLLGRTLRPLTSGRLAEGATRESRRRPSYVRRHDK